MTGKLILIYKHSQCAKKGLSHSPGLVDFAIGLVNSVFFSCLTSKLRFLQNSNYRRTVVNPAYQKNFFGVVKMTVGLVHASYSLSKWQSVKLTFFAPFFSEEFTCWVPRISKF